MYYELAVCSRYLRPRFSRAYISFNTLISVLGIAVGVTTLITVIAVMTGLGNHIRESFTGFYSHIIVSQRGAPGSGREYELLQNYPDLLQHIEETDGVAAASPFVLANVALGHAGMSYNRPLRAVDPHYESKTSTIKKKMLKGEFAFPVEIIGPTDFEYEQAKIILILIGRAFFLGEFAFPEETTDPVDPDLQDEQVKIVSILVSKAFAEQVGLKKGDEVRIASSSISAVGRGQRVLNAKVNGIFSFGAIDQDQYLYSNLETGQILLNSGLDVSGISVLTEDLSRAVEVRDRLAEKLGPDYEVITWIEMSPELFQLLDEERFVMYFIVALIVAVAALNIISSLSMMVNHKRKEIGILRSLGAKRRSITAIFGLMGVSIGLMGTGLGVIGGLLLSINFNSIRSWVSNVFNFNLFSVYDEIPVQVRTVDIVVISGIAMGLCILVSVYPTWKASRLHPVEALRYE